MSAASILLSIGLVVAQPTAAPSSAASGGTSSARPARVTIAKSAGDLDVMRKWMLGAASGGMADAKVDASEVAADRELVIEIEGSLLDYQYFVGVRTPDGWAGQPHRAACTCKDDDLIKSVRGAVGQLAPNLRAPKVESAPAAKRDRPQRLGRGGIAGVALISVGAAAAIAGIVMLALPARWSIDEEMPAQEQGKTLRLPGGILAGVGVGLVAGGAVLVHRDRSKRRVAVTPTAGGRGFGVAAVVRF